MVGCHGLAYIDKHVNEMREYRKRRREATIVIHKNDLDEIN